VNLVKKHQAGSGDMKGGVYLMEAPIAVSSVSLIDPQDDRPCKTKWVFLEGGVKERQSKRTGVIVPRNKLVLETRKTPVAEGPLDTQPDVVTRATFSLSELIPKLNFNLKRAETVAQEVKETAKAKD
jgi:ribosomal protein L24